MFNAEFYCCMFTLKLKPIILNDKMSRLKKVKWLYQETREKQAVDCTRLAEGKQIWNLLKWNSDLWIDEDNLCVVFFKARNKMIVKISIFDEEFNRYMFTSPFLNDNLMYELLNCLVAYIWCKGL